MGEKDYWEPLAADVWRFIETVENERAWLGDGPACTCPLGAAMTSHGWCPSDSWTGPEMAWLPVNPDPIEAADMLDLTSAFAHGVADAWDGTRPDPEGYVHELESDRQYVAGLLVGGIYRARYQLPQLPAGAL